MNLINKMTEQELKIHFDNVAVAAEKFIGTKKEHIQIEVSLLAIKEALFPKKDEETTDTTSNTNN